MKRAVILTEEEWRRLPVLLGRWLANTAAKPGEFKVVSRETGEEVTDRLHDYLVGLMALAVHDLEKHMGVAGG